MEFKVRKGLETPLLIHGMLSNYFYLSSVLGGVLAMIVFVSISGLLKGDTSFFQFFLVLFFSLAIYLGTCFILKRKSSINKLNFNKKTTCISNRDLLKSIK